MAGYRAARQASHLDHFSRVLPSGAREPRGVPARCQKAKEPEFPRACGQFARGPRFARSGSCASCVGGEWPELAVPLPCRMFTSLARYTHAASEYGHATHSAMTRQTTTIGTAIVRADDDVRQRVRI